MRREQVMDRRPESGSESAGCDVRMVEIFEVLWGQCIEGFVSDEEEFISNA